MSDAPASLRALYAREAARRGYQQDAAQLAVIDRLEDLRKRLAAAAAPPRTGLGGLLRSVTCRFNGPPAPVRGLYLWGSVGRGKTFLMDLFFHALPPGLARRRHFHRFMHDVHAELAQLTDSESPLELVAARIARESRVICLDELFVTDIGDAMILGGLFEGLFRRGVTLVATSNARPGDLYRDGLQRQRFLPAIRLLEQHMEVCAVGGDVDHRLRQLTQAGTYLDAAAPGTAQALREIFAALSDDDGREGGTLEIEDRHIPVVRESGNVVWFDFPAICDGPRSQNDYIEIAHEYHSVIVSGVPVLDAPRENEARRFIALVDELYDRNVTLVLSAAAPPVALYRGERLHFEFERTASRLIEMQSREYLAREHRG